MDRVCFALPVVAGKTPAARAFMSELEGARKAAYALSEQRIGIIKECWFLQESPLGDLLIAYMESSDFTRALRLFAESRDDFDVWFKAQMADVSDVDLNNPPQEPLSEMLSCYTATPER